MEVEIMFYQFYAIIGYFYYDICSTPIHTKVLVKQNALSLFKDIRSMELKGQNYARQQWVTSDLVLIQDC